MYENKISREDVEKWIDIEVERILSQLNDFLEQVKQDAAYPSPRAIHNDQISDSLLRFSSQLEILRIIRQNVSSIRANAPEKNIWTPNTYGLFIKEVCGRCEYERCSTEFAPCAYCKITRFKERTSNVKR